MQVIEDRRNSHVSSRKVIGADGLEITESLDRDGNVITRINNANGDVDFVLTPTEIKLFALEKQYDNIKNKYGDNGNTARDMNMIGQSDTDYCASMDKLWEKQKNHEPIADDEIQDAWNKQQTFETELRSGTRIVTVGKAALTLVIPGGPIISGGRLAVAAGKVVFSAAKVGFASAADATVNSVNAGNDTDETLHQAGEAGILGATVGAVAPVAQTAGVYANTWVATEVTLLGAPAVVTEGAATIAGGTTAGRLQGYVMGGANALVDGKPMDQVAEEAKESGDAGAMAGAIATSLTKVVTGIDPFKNQIARDLALLPAEEGAPAQMSMFGGKKIKITINNQTQKETPANEKPPVPSDSPRKKITIKGSNSSPQEPVKVKAQVKPEKKITISKATVNPEEQVGFPLGRKQQQIQNEPTRDAHSNCTGESFATMGDFYGKDLSVARQRLLLRSKGEPIESFVDEFNNPITGKGYFLNGQGVNKIFDEAGLEVEIMGANRASQVMQALKEGRPAMTLPAANSGHARVIAYRNGRYSVMDPILGFWRPMEEGAMRTYLASGRDMFYVPIKIPTHY